MRRASATGCKMASRMRPEGNGTTETGSYTLNGAITDAVADDRESQSGGRLVHTDGE